MKTPTSKLRNPNSELIRLLACLIVIGVHTCPSYLVRGKIDYTQLLIACFLADGVAIFWLLTGFYVFNTNYTKLLKHSCTRIMMPAFLFGLFCFCCINWLSTPDLSLVDSLSKIHLFDLVTIIKKLIRLQNPFPTCGHYWYLFAYLLFIFSYPLWKSYVTYLDSFSRFSFTFLILSLLFFMLNDCTRNQLANFSHHSINSAIPAAVEIIWGHVIFQHQGIILKIRHVKTYSLLLFLLLNCLRVYLQACNVKLRTGNAILFWYSSIGLLCGVCICIFCLSISVHKIQKYVILLGSFTFPVYLTHMLIRKILYNRFNVSSSLMLLLKNNFSENTAKFVYSLSIVLVIFTSSLIFTTPFVWTKKKLCSLIIRKK